MSPLRRAYHRTEAAIKSLFVPNVVFENIGLRYVGPIDGHDLDALLDAFAVAKAYDRPIVLHVATVKGRGFAPAEHEPHRWHGVAPFDVATGTQQPHRGGYSEAFGDALAALAADDDRIVAITAAMRAGTGLDRFAERFPQRLVDVGICEAHAVVFAAGLACAGLRPVVALYSTFMQRAVDCVLHDVCLQSLPVLFCLDRAGVVGADGPTHHGLFDLPMLRCLPGLAIMQPRDEAMLARMLATALAHDGPCVIRYPRDRGPGIPLPDHPAPLAIGTAEVLLPPPSAKDGAAAPGGPVWLWALGDMLPLAHQVADRLQGAGIAAGVVDARFVQPLDRALLRRQAPGARLFATLENGALAGGFGSALQEALSADGCGVPVRSFGWPDAIVEQGTTESLRSAHGLTAPAIAAAIVASCSPRRTDAP
jgi:1-deoxy-D-xylulose-5-phosphate synthase